ncbi:hypothetical protein FB451DRAFT_1406527 [Mycena latifolia]|nr:hypothetical protein FB451DRAFT_1406527 [Mycena latifolia]
MRHATTHQLHMALDVLRDCEVAPNALYVPHPHTQHHAAAQLRPIPRHYPHAQQHATLALLPVDPAFVAAPCTPTLFCPSHPAVPRKSRCAHPGSYPPATSPPSSICACGVQHMPPSFADAASPHATAFLSAATPGSKRRSATRSAYRPLRRLTALCRSIAPSLHPATFAPRPHCVAPPACAARAPAAHHPRCRLARPTPNLHRIRAHPLDRCACRALASPCAPRPVPPSSLTPPPYPPTLPGRPRREYEAAGGQRDAAHACAYAYKPSDDRPIKPQPFMTHNFRLYSS